MMRYILNLYELFAVFLLTVLTVGFIWAFGKDVVEGFRSAIRFWSPPLLRSIWLVDDGPVEVVSVDRNKATLTFSHDGITETVWWSEWRLRASPMRASAMVGRAAK